MKTILQEILESPEGLSNLNHVGIGTMTWGRVTNFIPLQPFVKKLLLDKLENTVDFNQVSVNAKSWPGLDLEKLNEFKKIEQFIIRYGSRKLVNYLYFLIGIAYDQVYNSDGSPQEYINLICQEKNCTQKATEVAFGLCSSFLVNQLFDLTDEIRKKFPKDIVDNRDVETPLRIFCNLFIKKITKHENWATAIKQTIPQKSWVEIREIDAVYFMHLEQKDLTLDKFLPKFYFEDYPKLPREVQKEVNKQLRYKLKRKEVSFAVVDYCFQTAFEKNEEAPKWQKELRTNQNLYLLGITTVVLLISLFFPLFSLPWILLISAGFGSGVFTSVKVAQNKGLKLNYAYCADDWLVMEPLSQQQVAKHSSVLRKENSSSSGRSQMKDGNSSIENSSVKSLSSNVSLDSDSQKKQDSPPESDEELYSEPPSPSPTPRH